MSKQNGATRVVPATRAANQTIDKSQHAAPRFAAQGAIVFNTPEALDEFAEIVADKLLERISARQEVKQPAREYVGPTEAARALSISRSTLHRLRHEGAPALKRGDIFKFSVPELIQWLKNRSTK